MVYMSADDDNPFIFVRDRACDGTADRIWMQIRQGRAIMYSATTVEGVEWLLGQAHGAVRRGRNDIMVFGLREVTR